MGNIAHRDDVARLARIGVAAKPSAGGHRQRLFRARRVIECIAGLRLRPLHAIAQAVAPERRPIMARRSLLDTQSIAETVTRIIRMMKATRCHSAWAISFAR